MSPRWHKVLSDLWSNKLRTLLVVLSISVGVFGVGVVASSYIILMRDVDADYQSVNPHGAVIYTWQVDDDLLAQLGRVPGVGKVEGRGGFSGRLMFPGDQWRDLSVMVIPPANEMEIDMLRADTPIQLGKNEILIERGALLVMPFKVGDVVQVELPDERVRNLRIAGIVHDITAMPAVMAGSFTGYINLDTLEELGMGNRFDQVYLTVSERTVDEAHVREVGKAVADRMEDMGQPVYFTAVFQPGKHPFKQIVQGLLALLSGLGVFLVFLSGFLVINTISAILTQHVRQIGVMKAIGARPYQIAFMYFTLVLAFGLLAALLAIPLSSLAALTLVQYLAGFMNVDLSDSSIPLAAVIIQLVLALGVPLMASIWPVQRGTRLTIREAISNYGLGQGIFGKSLIDRVLEKIRFLSRPLLISLRNTFRRKGRLLLTLSTLVLGGAIFIAVFNTRASINETMEETFGYFLSDISMDMNRTYRTREIEDLVMRVPGVEAVEGWIMNTANVVEGDEETGLQLLIWGPPSKSTLIKPVMVEGRWLVPEDENAIVIGNHVLVRRPDLKVGDTLKLNINERTSEWKIVGIFKMAGNVEPPFVYVNGEALTKVMHLTGRSFSFRITTRAKDKVSQERVVENLTALMETAGIQVGSIQSSAVILEQQQVGTNILIAFLLVMAILIAVVGGLGLTGTMSMNVIERTREIGVLRAIGASDGAVLRLVLVEGMFIGILSWVLGALLAVPISQGLSAVVGIAFMTVPLPYVFSMDGFIIWLIVVVILSIVSSFLPAFGASRLTVRDVLAYE